MPFGVKWEGHEYTYIELQSLLSQGDQPFKRGFQYMVKALDLVDNHEMESEFQSAFDGAVRRFNDLNELHHLIGNGRSARLRGCMLVSDSYIRPAPVMEWAHEVIKADMIKRQGHIPGFMEQCEDQCDDRRRFRVYSLNSRTTMKLEQEEGQQLSSEQ